MQLKFWKTEQQRPVLAKEFASKLARLGPFEINPRLAVACSGGADSMALLHLAQEWAVCRHGRATALIVDHGLRVGSTEEARHVSTSIRNIGIEAIVLTLTIGSPLANIQAKAREGRYHVLKRWCQEQGCLNLLVGHHRNDQAETIKMRAERGSGADGLAGMSPILEYADVRILRPLLGVEKTRLQLTAIKAGMPVVEDPTNKNSRFERVRIRRTIALEGGTESLIDLGSVKSKERLQKDIDTSRLLALSCEIYPEGYAILNTGPWKSSPDEICARALSALCSAIGGRSHPPRREKVLRLQEAIRNDSIGAGRTLAGCRIVPKDWKLIISREYSLMERRTSPVLGRPWDGRFIISKQLHSLGDIEIGALGKIGLRQIIKLAPDLEFEYIPSHVLPTLPAIWGLEGVQEVPHLLYSTRASGYDKSMALLFRFAPIRPLQATRYTL